MCSLALHIMRTQMLSQYGDIFSFTMVGKTFTYLLGPESVQLFFDSKNEDLNAEEVYSKLITPVFGKGVAYDAPNKVSLPLVTCLQSPWEGEGEGVGFTFSTSTNMGEGGGAGFTFSTTPSHSTQVTMLQFTQVPTAMHQTEHLFKTPVTV